MQSTYSLNNNFKRELHPMQVVATILKFDIAPQCYVGGLKELLKTFQVLPTQTLYTAEAVLE